MISFVFYNWMKFHCICWSRHPFICWWTPRPVPSLNYHDEGSKAHWCMCISVDLESLGILGSYDSSIFRVYFWYIKKEPPYGLLQRLNLLLPPIVHRVSLFCQPWHFLSPALLLKVNFSSPVTVSPPSLLFFQPPHPSLPCLHPFFLHFTLEKGRPPMFISQSWHFKLR